MKRREAWFESQLDLDPERLVFIDETWASTNMARRYGRAPQGGEAVVGRLPFLNEREMHWIVEVLFIGNKLVLRFLETNHVRGIHFSWHGL